MVLIGLSGSVAQAASLFMGTDELRPGMTGIGKTVVSGTKIEDFDVEIIDIMRQPGNTDLILVRTSGDVIDRTGGIAQGMSGSPVFVDGRLIGAVAYGWKLSDSRIGMVTPIADMMKLSEKSAPIGGEATTLLPKGTPLMASGFTERGLAHLKNKLSAYGLEPMSVGMAPAALAGTVLEPGASVGAELVRGDISLGAIGTVTWVEDNRIWAFGHPFLRRGPSDYFLSNAWVYTTVPSISSPFKLGAPGELLGRIGEDRQAGLTGETGRYPKIIPMLIKVKDLDRGTEQTMALQVVQDEQMGALLCETSVFNVVDQVLDRTGEGTAAVKFHVAAVDTPDDQQIERSNMFYHPANISGSITDEFYEAINMLLMNRFHPVTIMDVGVEVEVTGARKTGNITAARALEKQVHPGETVELEVKFDTWRGGAQTRTAKFTVPKEQKPGDMRLVVRGGAGTAWLQLLMKQQEQTALRKTKKKELSFEEIMTDFLKQDRNNDIVVDMAAKPLTEAQAMQQQAEQAAAEAEADGAANDDQLAASSARAVATSALRGTKYKQTTPIDYVIDGEAYVTVKVVQ